MTNQTSDPVSMDTDLAAWFNRVMARSTMTPYGCWIWTGWRNHKGYGYTSFEGQNVAVHRKVFELTRGVLLTPEQFACHTCDERRCWNPGHLFLGDAEANNNDCADKGRHHNSVKTHCKFGHLYDEANTGYKTLPSGSIARVCKACVDIGHRKESYIQWRRDYQRRRRAEKRAAAQAGAK